MNFCMKCGKQCDDGDAFCRNCGQLFPNSEAEPQASQTTFTPSPEPAPATVAAVTPKSSFFSAAGSSRYLTGAIFASVSFLFGILSILNVNRVISAIIDGTTWWAKGLSEWLGAGDVWSFITDSLKSFIFIIYLIPYTPIIILLAGIWIVYGGGKAKASKTAKTGTVIVLVIAFIYYLINEILPVLLIVSSFFMNSTEQADVAALFSISIIWAVLVTMIFLPLIILGFKMIKALRDVPAKSYGTGWATASLIVVGCIACLAALPLLFFAWLMMFSVIFGAVACFIFAGAVSDYNKSVKNSSVLSNGL